MPERDSPPEGENTDIFADSSPSREEYPCLQQISSPGRGARYRLFPGKNLIGRSEEADVALTDSSVSREHAELDVREGGAIVRDLGSRNGTQVEGQPVTSDTPITHNQRLRVGGYEFQYLTTPAPLAPEPEAPPSAEVPSAEPPAEKPAEEGGAEPAVPAGQEMVPVEEAAPPVPYEEVPVVPAARWTFVKKIPPRVWLIGAGIVLCALFLYASYRLAVSWFGEEEKVPPEVGGTVPLSSPQAIPETTPVEQPEYVPVFLEFSSTPLGAQVFFGDEPVGTTPFRMNAHLQYGKVYEVRALFRLEELGETMEERLRFSLVAGEQVIPLTFKASIGHFKVTKLPRQVDLYLEGSFAHDPHRAKPIKFNEIVLDKPIYLPFGTYHVELKRSRQLAASKTFISEVIYRRDFVITAEGTSYELSVADRDLTLFPVTIRSTPDGADCLIDGEKVGMTPYEGELPIGAHALVLRKEGYFEHTQPIRVDLNTPFLAEIELKTSEAGRLINEGRLRIRQKRYPEAIDLLVDALRSNPTPQEVAESHYLVGQAYLYLGEYEDARDHFLQGMRHEDFRYAARLGIAQISFNQGERIHALQVLIEVLVSAKRDEVRSEAAALFQQISPFKSVLYINTDPEGAKLTVNGKDVSEVTPLILHDLMVGIYRLHLSLPGYQTEEIKVDLGVSEFKPIAVKLRQVAGEG